METLKDLFTGEKQKQEKTGIVRGKTENGQYLVGLVGQSEIQAFSRVGELKPGEKVILQEKQGRVFVVAKSGRQHENTAKIKKYNIKG